MTLVVGSPHNKYGSVVCDLKVNSISVCKQGTVKLITVEMVGLAAHFVYKPMTKPFVLPALEHSNLLRIIISNSHCTTCEHISTDDVGNTVEQWSDS